MLERKHEEIFVCHKKIQRVVAPIGPWPLWHWSRPRDYAAPQGSGYNIIRRMPIGGDGGWDYLKVDPDAHRLYIARGTHIDGRGRYSGKVIGDINRRHQELSRIDAARSGQGLHEQRRRQHGFRGRLEDAQGHFSHHHPRQKSGFDHLRSGDQDGSSPLTARAADSTAIDATTGKVVGTVELGGKPEEAILDGNGNMFVNLEDKSVIMEFDTKTLAVKGTWPLAPCEGPSALAYDSAHHRLFVACDKVMAVVNADTGKVVASPPIGGDPDGNGLIRARDLLSQLAAKAWFPSFTRIRPINTRSSATSPRNSARARWRWTPKRTTSSR